MLIRFLCVFFCAVGFVCAQDLNCAVKINASQINSSDPKVFSSLENALTLFLNGTQWSNRNTPEKINCQITILLQQQQGNFFAGKMQVQASRPVYHTDYQTSFLNFQDNDIQFQYVANDILQYNENFLSSNLVALLSYYAYLIIGLEAASFAPDTAAVYFQKMMQITDLAQQNHWSGWQVSARNNGRYAFANALLDATNKNFHTLYYNYHIQGIDLLADAPEQARQNIANALINFANNTPVNYQNAFLVQSFFDAKTTEIKNIFATLPDASKKALKRALKKIQPNRNWDDF